MKSRAAAIAVLLFFVSTPAFSDGNQNDSGVARDQLLHAIRAQPNCDNAGVTRLLKQVDIDDEILFLMVMHQCGDAMGAIQWKKGDGPKIIGAVNRVLRFWKDDYFPKRMKSVKDEGLLPNKSEVYAVSSALGWATGVSGTMCKKNKTENWCSLSPRLKQAGKQFSELSKVIDAATSEDQTLLQLCMKGDDVSCFLRSQPALLKKRQILRQRPRNWILNQVADGVAIFRYEVESGASDYSMTAQRYLIGVEKSSIKKSLRPGMSLDEVPGCLKAIRRSSVTNIQGFAVSVIYFKAVNDVAECPPCGMDGDQVRWQPSTPGGCSR